MEWGGGVGREEIGHFVLTVCRQVLLTDTDLETDIGHAERDEPLLHFCFDYLGRFGAQHRELIGLFLTLGLQLVYLSLLLLQGLVTVVNMV